MGNDGCDEPAGRGECDACSDFDVRGEPEMRGKVDTGQGAAGEGGADEHGTAEVRFGLPVGVPLDTVGRLLTLSTIAGMVILLVLASDRVVAFAFLFFLFFVLNNVIKRDHKRVRRNRYT